MIKPGEKTIFLLKNLGRGLLWLGVLLAVFLIIKNNVDINFMMWLEPYFKNIPLVITIFSLSEVFFGIIPPEIFMIWALQPGILDSYVFYITVFASISYVAGFVGYLIGAYLNTTLYFRYVRKRYWGKYHSLLKKFGVFLILVAALTPVPFSAISMFIGSLQYPLGNYLLWASARFLRFALYATIIWEANLV